MNYHHKHNGNKEAIHKLMVNSNSINSDTILKKRNIEKYKKFITCGSSGNKTYGTRRLVSQHTCGFVTGKCCKHTILPRRWSCCPHKEIIGTWFDLDAVLCDCGDGEAENVTISKSIDQTSHERGDLYVVPSSPC